MITRLSRFFHSQSKPLYKDMIQRVLVERLKPSKFFIEDESAKHHEAFDSHFAIYVVSEEFQKKSKIQRYKALNFGSFSNTEGLCFILFTNVYV